MKKFSRLSALAFAAALTSGAGWAVDLSGTVTMGALNGDGIDYPYDQSAVIPFNVSSEDVGKYISIEINSQTPVQLNVARGHRNWSKELWTYGDWNQSIAGQTRPVANTRVEFQPAIPGRYTLVLTTRNDHAGRYSWEKHLMAPRDVVLPYSIATNVASQIYKNAESTYALEETFPDTFSIGEITSKEKAYRDAQVVQKSSFNWQAYNEEYFKVFNEYFSLTKKKFTKYGTFVPYQIPFEPNYKPAADASSPIRVTIPYLNFSDRVLDPTAWTHEVGHVFSHAVGWEYGFDAPGPSGGNERYESWETTANYYREWLSDPDGRGGAEKQEFIRHSKLMLSFLGELKHGYDPDIDPHRVMINQGVMLLLKNYIGNWDFLQNTIEWYLSQNVPPADGDEQSEQLLVERLLIEIEAIDPAKATVWKNQLAHWGLNYPVLANANPVDGDNDGFVAGLDTNDNDASISPARDEYFYSGVDTDYSGYANDGVLVPINFKAESFLLGSDLSKNVYEWDPGSPDIRGSHVLVNGASAYCLYSHYSVNADNLVWSCFNFPNMAWDIQQVANGLRIKQFAENLCLSSTSNGVKLQTCNSADNKQTWERITQANGGFGYKNKNSGKCLSVDGHSYFNGAGVIEEACSATEFQQWDYVSFNVKTTRRRTLLAAGENLKLDVESHGVPIQIDVYQGNAPYIGPNNEIFNHTNSITATMSSVNSVDERHKTHHLVYQTDPAVNQHLDFVAPLSGIYTIEFTALAVDSDYAHPITYKHTNAVVDMHNICVSINGATTNPACHPDWNDAAKPLSVGDKVSYKGKYYISTVNWNYQEPSDSPWNTAWDELNEPLVAVESSRGKVYPKYNSFAAGGRPFTFTARSEMGYELDHFLVDGQVVLPDNPDALGPKTVTIANVSSSMSIEAVFKPEVRLHTYANITPANEVIETSRWNAQGKTFSLNAPAQVNGRGFQGWQIDNNGPAIIAAAYSASTTVVVNGDVSIQAIYETDQHIQSLKSGLCVGNSGSDMQAVACQTGGPVARWEQVDSVQPGFVQIKQYNVYGYGTCVQSTNTIAGSAVTDDFCIDSANQQWTKLVQDNGAVKLKNGASNLCLTINNTGDLIQEDCNSTTLDNEWRFTTAPSEPAAMGATRIKNLSGNYCFDSFWGRNDPGTPIIAYTCNSFDSLLWYQVPASNGSDDVMLKQHKSKHCMQANDMQSGSQLTLGICSENANTLWEKIVQSDGSVKYKNRYSLLCISKNPTTTAPDNVYYVTQRDCDTATEVTWQSLTNL